MRALLGSVVLIAAVAQGQAVVTPISTAMDPTPRRSTGLAFNGVDTWYAYGGFVGGAGADSNLWVLTSGGGWLALAPTMGSLPPAKEQHGLAYAPPFNLLVLFGGFNSAAAGQNDTWILDVANAAWLGPFSPATKPSGRGGALLLFEPTSRLFFTFGGISNALFGGSRNNEVWSLDVADGGVTWKQVTTSGTAPTVRNAWCGAIDPNTRSLIVFGGEAGNGGTNNGETWSLDLVTAVWRNDTPTGTVPSARSYCAAAWDQSSRRMLLYGGQTNNPIGGAFAYDPVARVWADVTPSMNVGNRSDQSAAPNPTGGIRFFGGRTAATTYTSQTVLFTLDAGAAADAGVDAGIDAGVDAGIDAGVDAGFDAGVDAGFDAGVDGGPSMVDAGMPADSGVADAGVADAGVVDAGVPDAGTPDAGTVDSGTPDSGSVVADAGGADAGGPDASVEDAGALADAGDGLTPRVTYGVGCGCGESPLELALALSLVLLGRRRFRS